MTNDYRNLFKGTAKYYTKFRSIYPSALVRFLVQKFSLDGTGRMLDIGCGTGQLTVRFSDWFEHIIGIDKEPEMVEEAKRICDEMRIMNVEWLLGEVEECKELHQQSFKLVTFAKSFHWMNREKILNRLYDMVSAGGGVAIIDHYNPEKEPEPWQKIVNAKVEKWYGEARRAGDKVYEHPKASHSEIIQNSMFDLELHKIPSYQQKWTVETIIGHLYSTSYGRKQFLDEQAPSFEKDLKEALLEFNAKNEFIEEVDLKVILALKNDRR